jgi:hypothetical protein
LLSGTLVVILCDISFYLDSAVSALSPEPISHSSRSLHLPMPELITSWARAKSVLATIGPALP